MDGGRMTATKINKLPVFVSQDFTASYTANANSGSGAVDFACVKSGYEFIGVVGVASGSQQVACVQFKKFDSTTGRAYFRNVSGTNYSPTATMTALFVRTT
jgi:hypothetical protein